MDVHVSLNQGSHLWRQIYEQLRDAIVDGRLRCGDPLPPSRELAERLAVSRTTINTAYEQLTGDGYLIGRAGVGTFVSDRVLPGGAAKSVRQSPLQPLPAWRRARVPSRRPPPRLRYDFGEGLPDHGRFPFPTWRSLMGAQLRGGTEGARTTTWPSGHPALRSAVERYLGLSRGLQVTAEDIVITTGMQQAVSLLAQVLIRPGDVVVVEEPGYRPIESLLRTFGAQVVNVPVDECGLVVDELPERATLAYVSPAHQFPLGVTMSQERRHRLLAWAEHVEAAIIECDYGAEYRFSGQPVEALAAMDSTGRVLHVGSFSRSTLTDLRIGYCITPPALTESLRLAKSLTDGSSSMTMQLALAEFIDRGHLARHLRRMRRLLGERRARITQLLDEELFPWVERIPSSSGVHVACWAQDPDPLRVDHWVERARAAGVNVGAFNTEPGSPGAPGLMIGYGAIELSAIDRGLRLLRDAMRSR